AASTSRRARRHGPERRCKASTSPERGSSSSAAIGHFIGICEQLNQRAEQTAGPHRIVRPTTGNDSTFLSTFIPSQSFHSAPPYPHCGKCCMARGEEHLSLPARIWDASP